MKSRSLRWLSCDWCPFWIWLAEKMAEVLWTDHKVLPTFWIFKWKLLLINLVLDNFFQVIKLSQYRPLCFQLLIVKAFLMVKMAQTVSLVLSFLHFPTVIVGVVVWQLAWVSVDYLLVSQSPHSHPVHHGQTAWRGLGLENECQLILKVTLIWVFCTQNS